MFKQMPALRSRVSFVLAILCAVAALPRETFAYSSFIGYGYTSCEVCHFNAFGGGPLTDYGRALGATAIAAKPFWNLKVSDDELGEQSGFFFGSGPELLNKFRFQASYRGMYFKTGIGSSDENAALSRYINMQADLSVVYSLMEGKLIFLGTLGYIPPPQGDTSQLPSSGKSPFISREHYVSYAFTPEIRAYLGMTDVAFGIRHPDHVAANRTLPGIAQNDQVHGLLLHWGFTNAELGLHAFVGNLFEPNANVRQKGGSMIFEYDLLEKLRIGTSFLYSKSALRDRWAWALHGRIGIGEGSALLGEVGIVRTVLIDEDPLYATYVWGQSTARLFRGVHVLFTAQYDSRDAFHPASRNLLAGPSLQVFPFNRLELRADLWGSRVIGNPDSQPEDNFMANLQVHLWF